MDPAEESLTEYMETGRRIELVDTVESEIDNTERDQQGDNLQQGGAGAGGGEHGDNAGNDPVDVEPVVHHKLLSLLSLLANRGVNLDRGAFW